ncbi:hypothetical protein HYFRA_00008552 [Hymenoscyphus fraxineus]|uniref:Uncharacterized protein n=1 Tax=Hymenoscyphus fraxineus TaxID=746836 RepID=A0A9N9KW19_9HELO|nr:hypothetical protein HYFRA_00008552 [Hymenoscyphus fraxineus]
MSSPESRSVKRPLSFRTAARTKAKAKPNSCLDRDITRQRGEESKEANKQTFQGVGLFSIHKTRRVLLDWQVILPSTYQTTTNSPESNATNATFLEPILGFLISQISTTWRREAD